MTSFSQSKLSEKAPWIIISLIAIIASVPGRHKILFGPTETKLKVSIFFVLTQGLFLPETAGVNLPDTLESMKTFGK